MRTFYRFFRPAVLAFALAMPLLTWFADARGETVYTFGVVPQFEPRKLSAIWVPILKELEARTGLSFKMVGSPKIPDFETSFMAGEFDFAYMNPYHAMLAGSGQGYIPLVRDHGRKLFGILTVKKDSPIKDVKELDGATISFPAPNALGASLLMRADLDKIIGIRIKPLYVQTHSSVYLNVIFGKTPAGGGVLGTLNGQVKDVRESLRIIYKTREMPPHPVTAHPRVPAEHRERVRQALLDMSQTAAGAAMLAKVPFKKIGPASIEDYQALKTWGLEEYFVPE